MPHVVVVATTFMIALAGFLAVGASQASTAAADPGPNVQRSATGVTADALPTTQIDGVVWDQQIVGDTVYAGGDFKNARPAGAAPGTNLVPRSNLLSYNIKTGVLNSGFAPVLNAQAKVVTVSPDQKRVYVGGSFTTVSGVSRYRIAAFDTATGNVVASFAPAINAAVTAISVTNDAVYVGGSFTKVGSVERLRLAAFSPVNGALLGWAPTANSGVNALLVTPDKSRIIAAGAFGTINGSTATGLAAIDVTNASLLPWAANQVVHNYGTSSAMLSLSTDGVNVYSAGYWFGGTGNFEGVVAADPNSGKITWLADCHGDTYDATPMNGVVYSVSHWHYCSSIGGFPDTNPRNVWHRADAVTAAATGTVAHNGQGGYYDFYGQPAPSMVNWFPEPAIGTYTGQSQAGWSTTSNQDYLLQGGEFPTVNGVGQQGLVRYAVPSLATKKQAPRVSGTAFNPTLLAVSNHAVRVKWQANWDRDDQVLSYDVTRVGTTLPIYSTTRTAQFWNRPTMSFTDTSVVPGQTYKYRVSAVDGDGNKVLSDIVNVTVPATVNPYVTDVINDGASNYWRMNGTGSYADYAGSTDLTATAGVTASAPGALNGDTDGAATFNGSTGAAHTTAAVTGPPTFSAEAWFKTTTTSGGKILGFGDTATGNSSGYDRHIYMDDSGRINFGVYNGTTSTVRSGATYNDGAYHHVVGELSSAGLVLYIDGLEVGANASATSAQAYSGYWRVGSDNLGSWPDQPSSSAFNGTIDEVAIYSSALTPAQVKAHYEASAASSPVANVAPTAAFTSSVSGKVASFDASTSTDSDGTVASYVWDFADGSAAGSGKTSTHTYAAAGSYAVKLTVTDDKGATDTITETVTVAAAANVAPTAAFTSSVTGLTAAYDAAGSADSDGTIASYAWTFGDTSSGTGKTATRTYTTAGTYAVKLTVSDDKGATGTITKSVTVSAATTAVAQDNFNRTATKWGTADKGGTWTQAGSTFSTNGSTGNIKLAAAGTAASAYLNTVSQRNVNVVADVSLDSMATGGGTSTSFVTRKVGTSDYRLTFKQLPAGAIRLNLSRTVNGSATSLKDASVTGLTYAAKDKIRVRLVVSGSGTTSLSAKVWEVGSSEPAAAQITATDTTASLQAPGGFGFYEYLSGSSTTVPVTISIDNLLLTAN